MRGRKIEVGLALIDRLVTALANRLDDPTGNLRRTKPWRLPNWIRMIEIE